MSEQRQTDYTTVLPRKGLILLVTINHDNFLNYVVHMFFLFKLVF